MPCSITFRYVKDIDKVAMYDNDGLRLKEFIDIDDVNEMVRNWIDEQRSR